MLNKQNGYSEYSQSLQERAEKELVQAIWPLKDVTYPWNPLSPESEDFLADIEQEFTLEDWSEAEIGARSQAFFSSLDELWPTQVPDTIIGRLRESLSSRFAYRVPEDWLNAIATKASELMGELSDPAPAISLMDRMVHCVQELLPGWAEDDLQVLARPLAFAMRGVGTEAVDLALGAVRPLDWTELSDLERARLSLACARIAIAELETTDEL